MTQDISYGISAGKVMVSTVSTNRTVRPGLRFPIEKISFLNAPAGRLVRLEDSSRGSATDYYFNQRGQLETSTTLHP